MGHHRGTTTGDPQPPPANPGGRRLLVLPRPSRRRVYSSRPPTQLRLARARDANAEPKPIS
eukprot:1345124-Pyramimonas_sp.AAC.1